METINSTMDESQTGLANGVEDPEGLDDKDESLGDYPIDDILIRHDSRTIYEVVRRVDQGQYVMNPDFQRDFIWPEDKQSKLIESVVMRIPLPVFYMAEDDDGRMVVVDGLQRLSTFVRFLKGDLKLRLSDGIELNGKRFSDLSSKLKNRVEDCNLIFYTIDSKVGQRARLDIFERVNSGEPLSRQQMRNCLFMGPATRFLKEESSTDVFLDATGGSLNRKTMRDREFVNRYCAFRILDIEDYHGDMDDFLADCLREMNKFKEGDLASLSEEFHNGLTNNVELFGRHAFRKYQPGQERRSVINASLWDVMCTGLSMHTTEQVMENSESLRKAIYELLDDEDFITAITYATNGTKRVHCRFEMARDVLWEVLGAYRD